jgi:hypothetical protein
MVLFKHCLRNVTETSPPATSGFLATGIALCCVAGDAMNQFIRSNWQAVFKELKPVVDEAITTILTDAARKVFDHFTFAELFPVG